MANVKFSSESILKMRETEEGFNELLMSCKGIAKKQASKIYVSDATFSYEDRVQEAMFALGKAIETFNPGVANNRGNDFYTFANTVVRNHLLNEVSKFKSQRSGWSENEDERVSVLSLDNNSETKDGEGSSYKDNVEDETVDIFKEVAEDGWEWMRSFLTDKEFVMIRDYFFLEYTYEEVGEKYGVSKQAVRKNILKAMGKLRDRYDEGELAEKLGLH